MKSIVTDTGRTGTGKSVSRIAPSAGTGSNNPAPFTQNVRMDPLAAPFVGELVVPSSLSAMRRSGNPVGSATENTWGSAAIAISGIEPVAPADPRPPSDVEVFPHT